MPSPGSWVVERLSTNCDNGTVSRRLVLASGSPRRHRLLSASGYRFEVEAPEVDETPLTGEEPAGMVLRLARAKADTVLAGREDGVCVLACDTTVVLDGEVLGKPEGPDEAVAMLLRIGGRSHVVLSGYAIVGANRGRITGIERSQVIMTPIDRATATDYVATGEPLDKAGAYAIQGVGRRFVDHYEGSFSNIMGLPMEAVVPALASVGIVPGRSGPAPASV
jgi:septum formation protein